MKIILLAALYALALGFFWFMILYLIADHIKPLQKMYCKIRWHCHRKDYIYNGFDGASSHCGCKWCGYEDMVDSQGNLF